MAHSTFGPALMMMVLSMIVTEFGTRLPSAEGGFPGFQCPEGAPGLRYPCARDCQNNHNALYGHCGQGNDLNCYCSRPLASMAKGIQCMNKFNSNYDILCRTDCLCNHAALEGRCNYNTHTCECLGQNPNPTVHNFTLCPFQRHEDFEQSIVNMNLPYFPKSITAPMQAYAT